MGNTLTLDKLNNMVETAYGPLVLEFDDGRPIRLMPTLRLSRERREKLGKAMSRRAAEEKAAEESGDIDLNKAVDSITEMIELVCEYPDDADRIVRAVGGDGQKILAVWEEYMRVTRPGEAKPSPESSTTTVTP